MAMYIIRRAIQGFIILVLSTLLIYTILIITPGGPQDQINALRSGNPNRIVSQSYIDAITKAYKLDRPYPLNYLSWLFDPNDTTTINENNEVVPKGIDISLLGMRIRGSGVITGDFGTSISIAKGIPVTDLMGQRIVNTLLLTTTSLLLSLLLAFPIGIISAVRQYSKLDYAVTAFSFVGLSMPTFWLGLMLIIFLAVLPKQWHSQNGWTWLPYLPPGSVTDPGKENDFFNRIYHLVLPVTVLSFVSIAQFSRFVRGAMLEVLRQDYVRTAWAKGLSQRSVIIRHALRNALIPVITVVALSLPTLVSGAIATETVFAYAGMGLLFFTSVQQLDIPLIMGFLLIVTATIVVSNLLADVLYAIADPRIHYS